MKSKMTCFILAALMALSLTACGTSAVTTAVDQAAPAPTEPDYVIGTKSDDTQEILLTNALSKSVKEFYLRASADAEWGSNLITDTQAFEDGKQAALYVASTLVPQAEAKVITDDGAEMDFYTLSFTDMTEASMAAAFADG